MYGSQGYQPHHQGIHSTHQERSHQKPGGNRRRSKRKPGHYSPISNPQHPSRNTRVAQPGGYLQNQTKPSGGQYSQSPQRQVQHSYQMQSTRKPAAKGPHRKYQAPVQHEQLTKLLEGIDRDPLAVITGLSAVPPESMIPSHRSTKGQPHKIPETAPDTPWDQVKHPFYGEQLTLPEIEQLLKDQVEGKGKTFQQKVEDSVSKLTEYRQKHASVGEIKVNFKRPEGIKPQPEEKLREGTTYSLNELEGETRVVDWGAEPAKLGLISTLPRLLIAPLKELNNLGDAAPDEVKALLETKVRGIPLKHWGSYGELQEKCAAKFENFKKKAEPELKVNLERMLEDPQYYETEQRKFIAAVMDDIPQSFVDTQTDIEDFLEEFDADYVDNSTEFLLNKSYGMALSRQGWTLGNTLDQLIGLLEKANTLMADYNHDSGISSSAGTDSDSSSDIEGKA
ncbi:hypothetical protein [Endozoicomonas numazuensis]|uniref:Uncharacterized protein n=1 Tax=Endozoicomonas numazuensis TaxID=1137799 RepID=A0A081NEX2_9GAMM|nr:hypothetical protein [Endozoicomonas numazuensis]KEQ16995.1 hypothetical protein GZ78_20455 [Endozoicomonas numazuensis]